MGTGEDADERGEEAISESATIEKSFLMPIGDGGQEQESNSTSEVV